MFYFLTHFYFVTVKAALQAKAQNVRECNSGTKQKPQGHKQIYLIAVILSKIPKADFPKQEVGCLLY